MNFNIIDGTDDLDYDMVLQDYKNLELSVREIKEKHGITDGKMATNHQTMEETRNNPTKQIPSNRIPSLYIQM